MRTLRTMRPTVRNILDELMRRTQHLPRRLLHREGHNMHRLREWVELKDGNGKIIRRIALPEKPRARPLEKIARQIKNNNR